MYEGWDSLIRGGIMGGGGGLYFGVIGLVLGMIVVAALASSGVIGSVETVTTTVPITVTSTAVSTETWTLRETVTETQRETVTSTVRDTVTETLTLTDTVTETLTVTETATERLTDTTTVTSVLTTTSTVTQPVTVTQTQLSTITRTVTRTLTQTETIPAWQAYGVIYDFEGEDTWSGNSYFVDVVYLVEGDRLRLTMQADSQFYVALVHVYDYPDFLQGSATPMVDKMGSRVFLEFTAPFSGYYVLYYENPNDFDITLYQLKIEILPPA